MPTSYAIAVVIHVLAAFVWVGGVLTIGAVALPAARQLPEQQRRAAVSAIARRFRPIGWSALLVLIVTGFYLITHWGATASNLLSLEFFAIDRAKPVGVKLVLIALMLVTSGLHDWWVGPEASRLAKEEEQQRAETWRRWAALLGALTGLLVIGIVLVATVVARPWIVF
jgi:uncharacterized membrane protein